MKITKRQLRRIIKEEKAKILSEAGNNPSDDQKERFGWESLSDDQKERFGWESPSDDQKERFGWDEMDDEEREERFGWESLSDDQKERFGWESVRGGDSYDKLEKAISDATEAIGEDAVLKFLSSFVNNY